MEHWNIVYSQLCLYCAGISWICRGVSFLLLIEVKLLYSYIANFYQDLEAAVFRNSSDVVGAILIYICMHEFFFLVSFRKNRKQTLIKID